MEWGVLLQVLTAIGAIAIPVVMYPMLSIRNVALATAAVVFRVLEAMFYGVSALSSCALLRIGADAVGAGKHEAADAVVAVGNASNFILGVWSFCIAATAYYVVFARYCLVPRWMTTWGLVGVAGLASAALIALFGAHNYTLNGWVKLLAVPIAAQEVVLGCWLAIRGFSVTPAPNEEPPD
jgi:hypothetical protein